MKKNKLFIVVSAAIASASLSYAETATLDEVTVTANKFEQDIREIPSSISVISDIDIEDKNIQNITGVIQQIPNLSEISYDYQRAINFRGINQSLFTSTNPVVIYSDGVPQNSIFAYDVMLEDVERVEVLRGPQGTLYGKDSIGGVINVITKEPDNEWKGRVGLEYGSQNHMQGTINANGAIVDDTVFLNVGALVNKDDGWITNDYDGSDADADAFKQNKLNTTLTVKPDDKMSIKLSLGASKTKTKFINGAMAELGELDRQQAEHANYDVPTFTDNKALSQALNVEYDFDNVKFSSLSTHKRIKADGIYDSDYTYDPDNKRLMNGLNQFQDLDLDSFSQEFKLSSDENEQFKWVAGIYYDKENNQYKRMGYQFPYVDPNSGKFYGGFEVDIPSEHDGETKAIFAQGTYDISDELSLTLGGRYQKIDKDIDLTSYTYPVSAGKAGSIAKASQSISASWNTFLPKLAINYRLNDDASIYASYSKGYLPGGFNYFPTSPSDKIEFGPQSSDNFEIGLRGSFLDGDLDVGVSVFYMNIDDIHLYDAGYKTTGVFYSVVSNGGEATSKGIELDGTYRINDSWTINGAFGLTNAKYDKHTNPSYNGKTVRTTPKYTANIGVGYYHPEGLYGRLDINGQGSIYFDDANTQQQKAWATADIKIGYLKDDFNIYGYVKNITDEMHTENYRAMQNFVNEPRTFGIGMKYSF